MVNWINDYQRGYQTIASVRSPSKSESLFALHPAWKEHVSFVYVPDIATPGAFDDVFKSEKVGFDYIIHTASPVNFAVEDVKEDLLKPAIQGYGWYRVAPCENLLTWHRTLELMKAAHNLGGPQIKTFVLLSSAVAVLDSAQDMSFAGRDYTEEDWNTVRCRMRMVHSSLITNQMTRLRKRKRSKPSPPFWVITPRRSLANKLHGISWHPKNRVLPLQSSTLILLSARCFNPSTDLEL